MKSVAIEAVGLASAQGSLAEVVARGTPHEPREVPPDWEARACRIVRPALGVEPELEGAARWNRLARLALDECLADRSVTASTPLILASCNGAAAGLEPDEWREAFDSTRLLDGTPWQGEAIPILSGSCASGLQALAAGTARIRAGAPRVVVLAVDVLSRGSHGNFESLRVLSESLEEPWSGAATGFVPGEAAVAMLLSGEGSGITGRPHLPVPIRVPIPIHGPELSTDLGQSDGLARLLETPPACRIVFGQGTGPRESDVQEIRALEAVPVEVPIATPVHDFGHTVGASTLLSLALFLGRARWTAPRIAEVRGRPTTAAVPAGGGALFACRAMTGACGIAATEPLRPSTPELIDPAAPPPLGLPGLRDLVDAARDHRPARPPRALLVRLREPLEPPNRARIGGRILPSAVLEMTPGFLPVAISRAWGYTGPAACLVGPAALDVDPSSLAGHDATRVLYVARRREGLDVSWE